MLLGLSKAMWADRGKFCPPSCVAQGKEKLLSCQGQLHFQAHRVFLFFFLGAAMAREVERLSTNLKVIGLIPDALTGMCLK